MSKRKKSAAEIKVKLVIGYLAGSRSEFVFTAFFAIVNQWLRNRLLRIFSII